MKCHLSQRLVEGVPYHHLLLLPLLPAYQGQGTLGVLELSGLTTIGVVGGVLLTIYVNRLGASSPRSRKTALALFVASAVALVPVMFVTFASPWLALIVLTLLYVRWKWALVSTSD